MGSQIKNAFIAALMAGIIIAPVYGLQIVRSGMQSHIEPQWDLVLIGMGIVFVFQAFIRPTISRALGARKGSIRMPVLNDKARRASIMLLIAIALIWPFFTGRAEVDIATLVLIYVMLGLGLNIVVGFAGLL
ncbi:MAG TPA: DUF3382 domain-containing protein, partial [Burkholderiaceae bacterium]|nr:DUF3382 domain-containing protein [Burkholderiaceae bacterium]